MDDLREFFRVKALQRFRFALRGTSYDERRLEQMIKTVADNLDTELLRSVDTQGSLSTKWQARKHREARNHVLTAIEQGVKLLRRDEKTSLSDALRHVDRVLHEACKRFFRWLSDFVECNRREILK